MIAYIGEEEIKRCLLLAKIMSEGKKRDGEMRICVNSKFIDIFSDYSQI